jgi:hypothetical protein
VNNVLLFLLIFENSTLPLDQKIITKNILNQRISPLSQAFENLNPGVIESLYFIQKLNTKKDARP